MKKRILLFFLLVLTTLFLFGCSSISVSSGGSGEAVFKTEKYDVKCQITEGDAKTLSEIFDGKILHYDSVPSCGFSNDVSVKLDGKTFCFARDGCNSVMVGLGYFDLNTEEDKEVKKILESYGFYFPCI